MVPANHYSYPDRGSLQSNSLPGDTSCTRGAVSLVADAAQQASATVWLTTLRAPPPPTWSP